MKLFIILLFATLSFSAFAQWRLPNFGNHSSGGLRAVWSCDTNNRGEMPKEKEVEIYYDESGAMKFRPDIFRLGFNPINALGSLFGKRRQGSDVDQCLRAFLNTVPVAIRAYQAAQCEGSRIPSCSRNPSEIMRDVQQTVRNSRFYSKYQRELAGVTELTSREPVTVTEVRPEEIIPRPDVARESNVSGRTPEVVTPDRRPEPREVPTSTVRSDNTRTEPDLNPRRPVVSNGSSRDEVTRPQVNADRERTALLDYLSRNSSKIETLKSFASFCPDLGETTGANAAYCRQTMQLNNDFLTRVSQMFTSIRGEPVSVLRVVQSIECVPPAVNTFSDIEGILRRLDSKEECAPLPNVGDFKLFKKQPTPPAYYTTGNYLLKKTGDNAYEAALTLDFKNMGGSATPAQMMNSVKSCLGAVNPHLRGPGGQQISIRALTPQEAIEQLPAGERPLAGEINIQPDGIAVDAKNFTGNANCATITHELLHHLGLCDEYKEERTDIVPNMTRSRAIEWSCRNVPNSPSIMKNHEEAFNATVPQQFTCECAIDTCRRALTSSDPRAVAQRKIMMTTNSGYILGRYSSNCVQVWVPSTANIPDPDKAFTNVNSSGGVLTYEQRQISGDGSNIYTARANVTCTCPAGDESCPAALERAAGFLRQNPQTENCPGITIPIGEKRLARAGDEPSNDGNSFTIVTTPRNESLISPNHFDKILTGSCMTSPSSLYKQCSDYAYLPQDNATCANKPAACRNDNQFFGVTQQ